MNIIMAAFTFCIIFSDIVKSGDFINDKLHGSKNTVIMGKTKSEDYPDGLLESGDYIIKAGEM
jgi:glucose-1-phosphate adenylyltransferase